MKNTVTKLILPVLTVGVLTISSQIAKGQSVGIAGSAITPDAQSILDIQSTSKGILLPRMTTVQRTAISPGTGSDFGLMVYDTDVDAYYYWDGTAWNVVGNGAVNFLDDAYDGGGSGAGRTITADAGAVDITGPDGLRVNGRVGIGTTSPAVSLQINASDAVLLPKGNTAARPTGVLGYIRYNTQASQFEGFGAGNAWGSLGGVIDIDQDTKIEAEANSDEDKLRFTTLGTERMIIDNVGGIGVGTSSPDVQSILDVQSTTKGILLPRMTSVQRVAVSPTANSDYGMMVFDTNDNAYYYWDGTSWNIVGNGAVNFLDDAYDGGGSGLGRTITADAGAVNILGNDGLTVTTKIGLGTTSPDAQSILDISTTTKGVLMPRMTSVQRVAISPTTNSDYGMMVFDTNDKAYYYWDGNSWEIIGNGAVNFLDDAYDGGGSGLGRTITGDAGAVAITGTGGAVALTTDGDIQLTLDDAWIGAGSTIERIEFDQSLTRIKLRSADVTLSDGKWFGIDASNPNLLFQGGSTDRININNADVTIDNGKWIGRGSTIERIEFDGTNDEINILGANVGIGTTSPDAKLNVGDATGAIIYLTREDGVTAQNDLLGGLYFDSTDDTQPSTNDASAGIKAFVAEPSGHGNSNKGGYLTFFTKPNSTLWSSPAAERLRITQDGNIGIGETAPTAKLHVDGASGNLLKIDLASAQRLLLTSTGDLTITGKFNSNGIQESSDKRFKKNINPLENSLEKVMKMNGVSYNWRQDEFPNRAFGSKTEIGVIAQEIEGVLPELVSTDKDGYKSVQYSHMVPVLLEAIKEQQKIIENLTKEIEGVKAGYASLKKAVFSDNKQGLSK
ncbi:MAG: tail fiber domain-containing protein [Flavobacteriales bacterium]|nr:tail fiber domain-containing protein [Flavobacteriales bacterium]